MAVTVNGEPHPFVPGLTVERLLAEKKLSFPLKHVLLNGRLIPRSDYAHTSLADGDVLEIIHMISGG